MRKDPGELLSAPTIPQKLLSAPPAGAHLLISHLISHYLIDLGEEWSNLILKDVPNYLLVQAEVPMNGDIPQTCDLTPLDLRIALSDIGRDLLGGLTQDHQVVNDGIVDHFIRSESVKVQVLCITQKLPAGGLDVLKIELVVPGHIGPRSRSAPSASAGSTSL
jgi:hypothetical protein